MILVDISQVLFAALHVDPNIKSDINEEMFRHTVLNMIRSYRSKFHKRYGEIVLCYDSHGSWRKREFEHYKAGRKKAKQDSPIDWALVFEIMNNLHAEFKQYLPYKIVRVPHAEADDVIAALAEWSQTNDMVEGVLYDTRKPVLIISTDKDFKQLQKWNNVEQFNPILKKFIIEPRPDLYLKEHIIRGDAGDGIPNILSPANTFIVEGLRQRVLRSERLAEWVEHDKPEAFCEGTMLERYRQNQKLIDLSMTPPELKQQIIAEFEGYKTPARSRLIDYFIAKKLTLLMQSLEDF